MCTPSKPLVYLAGPYTKPDCVQQTHLHIQEGTRLIEDGLVTPFIPHLSLLWHIVTPRPYNFWLDYDKEVLANCAALYRPDLSEWRYSAGADAEEKYARELGIPVFYFKNELYDWVLLND